MNNITTFATRAALDEGFAEQVAQLLSAAIAKKGRASIAVSGGSTPKAFFNCLSNKALAWDKVTITLADERWVNADSDASNSRLVKENLLQNKAAFATFFELKVADELNLATLSLLNQQAKQQILPFDVLILGMGEDGHTASLFPCSEQINDALSLSNDNILMAVQPKTAPHQRITFTLSALLKSSAIFLHLCGENKQQVLQQALSGNDPVVMPIRAFLQDDSVNTQVMYAD
jgi:6-phosphogluconolactonase